MSYKIPLLLTSQAEGGFTVTSPLLPELITEGDSLDEVFANAKDAFEARSLSRLGERTAS